MRFPAITFPKAWGYESADIADIKFVDGWVSYKDKALTSRNGIGDADVASRLLLFTTLINKVDQDLYQQKIINKRIGSDEDRAFYCKLLSPQNSLSEKILERIILRSILPILDLVLEKVPNIANRTIHGEPLLYVSLRSKKSDVFKRLFEEKASINVWQGRTLFQSIGLACFWSIEEKKQQIKELEFLFGAQKYYNSQFEASIFGDETNLKRWDTTTREHLDLNGIYNLAKSTLHERAAFLCYSASNGHINILKWCLNNNTGLFSYEDENILCELGCRKDSLIRNALLWACYSNQLGVVKYLVEKLKADINKPVKIIKSIQKYLGTSEFHDNGAPVLHIASRFGHIDLVEYLVNAKAELNSIDQNGWTALMAAVEFNEIDVIKLLIANDASIRYESCRSYRAYPVGLNLENLIKSVPVSPFDRTPFLNAVRCGDLSTVKFFLNPRAKLFFGDKDGMTIALKLARENGNTRITKFLEYYLNKQLISSISENKTEEIDDWVKSGANINSEDMDNTTPLQLAIERNRQDCLKKLIELKADCSRQDAHGNTLILFAKNKQVHPKIIEILTAEEKERKFRESKVENFALSSDEEGNTELHRAVMEKKIERIEPLLKPLGSMNQKNKKGKTALNIALENKYEEDDTGRLIIAELRHGEKEKQVFNLISLLNSDLSFEETPYVGAQAAYYRIKLFFYHKFPDYLLRVIKNHHQLPELNIKDELSLQHILSKYSVMANGLPTQFLFSTSLKDTALYSLLLETNLIGHILKNKLESIDKDFEEKTYDHYFPDGITENTLKNIKEDFQSTLLIQEEFSDAFTLEHKNHAKLPKEDSQILWQYYSRCKSFKQIAVIFREIALGLKVIHDFGYIHLDLNYGNILFRLNQKNQVTAVKLIDFGKSQRLDKNGLSLFKGRSASNFHSPQFICCEALKEEKQSDVRFMGMAEDNYQFALLLYGVLLEKDFPHEQDILNQLKMEGVSKTIDSAYYCEQYSKLVYELMKKEYDFCLKENSSVLNQGEKVLLADAFDLIRALITAPSATHRQQINLLDHPFLRGISLSNYLSESKIESTSFIPKTEEAKMTGFQATTPPRFGSSVNLFRGSSQVPETALGHQSLLTPTILPGMDG